MEFEIIIKVPSLNEMIRVSRANKFSANRMKQDLEEDIMLQLYRQSIEKGYEVPIQEKVDIEFTFVETDKKRDKDNISASGRKICLDALVKRGILKNDGWAFIGDFKEKFEIGKENKVLIKLIGSKDSIK